MALAGYVGLMIYEIVVLIRLAVREKIEAVWRNKWDFADSGDGKDIDVKQYQPNH